MDDLPEITASGRNTVLIDFCREMKFSREDSNVKVAEKFGLELPEIEVYMEKYWKD